MRSRSTASADAGRARARGRGPASRPRATSAYVATRRLSSTVRSGSSRRPSGTTATPAFRICSGRSFVEAPPVDGDVSPARAQHAADGEHERRLAGAVRAEQRRHRAGRDLERDAVQHLVPATRDLQLLDPEGSAVLAHSCTASALSDVLGAEVRAHHVLVAQHLGRRPGRDEPAEVDHGGRLAARRDEAHVVVDEDDERADVRRGSSGSPARDDRSPRRAGRRPARRAARPAACRRPPARPRPAGARARRARRPRAAATPSSPTNSSAPSTSVRRDARFAPECSWIIATLSKIESFSIAISVWNVRRSPQRARR